MAGQPAVPDKDYIRRGTQVLAKKVDPDGSPTTYHAHLDHLGTPRLWTDAAGGIFSRRDYLPFGEEVMEGMDLEQLQFTGHERDEHASGSCTPPTAQINDTTLSNGEHIIACDEISSENTTIAGTGEVTFSTAGEIVLGPGFVVEDTVDWVADIDQELQLERQDLDYMHARYASPFLGRFGSVDPMQVDRLADPQSWNRYAYARSNPMIFIDPDGEDYSAVLSRMIEEGFEQPIPIDGVSVVVDRLKRGAREVGIVAAILTPVPGDEVGVGIALGVSSLSAIKSVRASVAIGKLRNIFFHRKGGLRSDNVTAAAREAAGEVVARKASGRAFDHLRTYRDSLAGAKSHLRDLQKALADPTLSPAERVAIERALRDASKRLDAAEGLFRHVRDKTARRLDSR